MPAPLSCGWGPCSAAGSLSREDARLSRSGWAGPVRGCGSDCLWVRASRVGRCSVAVCLGAVAALVGLPAREVRGYGRGGCVLWVSSS